MGTNHRNEHSLHLKQDDAGQTTSDQFHTTVRADCLHVALASVYKNLSPADCQQRDLAIGQTSPLPHVTCI